jgi:outer membrane receptor protein involved in Fe transport
MNVTFSLLLSLFFYLPVGEALNGDPVTNRVGNVLSTTTIITGKIVDKESQYPLEYSTISIYSLNDSLIATGGISDQDGHFSIETSLKQFFIKIEFIAYQPKTIEKIDLTNSQQTLDLGTIELESNIQTLAGAEVRAEKSSIVMSLDKRVFNVGKDLVSEGGTAEDILKNVPGVWVDINGVVSLRSSGGVRILLDGQSSLLVNGNNSNGLRQIQANSIDRIEIITNPSARYEAEGMSGIINIVLKKNQEKGLNGAVISNVGNPDNHGLGVNLNYRKNKVNFFSGIGAWRINRPGAGQFRNRFFNLENPDSTLFSNMDRTHERRSSPRYINAGADYYFNAKNSLTTSFYYRTNKDQNTSNLVYKHAYGSLENIHLITERQENETGEEANLNCFLRYWKLFSKKGHRLTSEIRFEEETEKEWSVYDELYFDGNHNPMDTIDFKQLSNSNSGNGQLVVRSDYILPVWGNAKFEAGFQSSFRSITDRYSVHEVISSVETPDTNFTNNFQYHEVIHGAYANFGNKVDQFSFQVGLRMEHSDVESALTAKDEINARKYVNLFPSAFVGYDLGHDNALQLSYSRRIERPTFWDLNPFYTLRDRRNIFRGNPNIRPEYTNAFELGYIRYWEKGTLSAITYYRITDDVIKRIQRVDARFPETTITQAENLDIKKNFGVEFTYFFALYDWWKLNGDLNFFHSFSEGTYQYEGREVYVGGKSFSLTSKTISRFTFWEKFNSQMVLSYAAPRTTTQGVNRATIALDLAGSVDLLKNNGTVTLSVSDVFNSRRRRSYSEDATFYSADNFLWQSRSVILSFHYRINQHKKQNQIYSSPIKEDDLERF